MQSCGVLVAVWLAWKCYLGEFVEVQRKRFETGFLKYFTKLVNRTTTGRKQKLFSVIRQMAAERDQPLKIVEIGAGPGANFEFLPSGAEITCVEPNEQFRQTLQENANKRPDIRLDLKCGKAEDLSCVGTGSQDVCISTYVLCSVNDVDKALREIYRILKPVSTYL